MQDVVEVSPAIERKSTLKVRMLDDEVKEEELSKHKH